MNALLRLMLLLLLLWAHGLRAQQIYPVDVSGMAIPPYSLDLEEYATLRPDGLTFFVTLNDPVEPFRDVILRLTIISDGEEIMHTDPNFIPPEIIRLQQFQPEAINGARLAPYFQGQNLLGARGGRGGSILPEGANQICLEVIDLQRRVPISGRYCLRGNFQLSLPPQLQLPANGAAIPQSRAASLLFNWTPKHLTSGNPPGPAEYTFTLIELLPGILYPNDAFEQSFRIYETTQLSPSFVYSEGLPLLETGKRYAWRVEARSIMGYKLFENDGRSEVFSFRIYDDDDGAEIGLRNNASRLERTDRNCAPFSVDFGPVPYGGQQSAPVAEGESLKTGFFEMEVTQINSQADGYSGKGYILIPFLKSKVKVRFRNVKTDEWKQVYEAGSIVAEKDNPEIDFDPGALTEQSAASVFNASFLESLSGYLESRQAWGRFTSHLSESVSPLTGLPLVLDKKDAEGRPLPPAIALDLRFGVREARMTALSFFPGKAPGEWIAFLAPNIGITPYGIQQGVGLELIGDVSVPIHPNMALLAHGIGQAAAPSSLICDCEGYSGWNPSLSLAFRPGFLTHSEGGEPVTLPLARAEGQIAELMATVAPLPPVSIAELPGFVLQADSGAVDFSPALLLPEVVALPASYQNFKKEAWQGAFWGNPKLSLPPEYDFSGAGRSPSLAGEALFADGSGLSGSFAGSSLLSLQEGRLGGWPCSIAQLSIDIRNSRIVNSHLRGKIKVPALAEAFPFEGRLQLFGPGEGAEISAPLQGDTSAIPMWQAQISLSGHSEIRARLHHFSDGQRRFLPSASLTGALSLQVSDEEAGRLLQEGRKELQETLGIARLGFRLENLELQGLRIDPFAEAEKRFRLEGCETAGASLHIGGKAFPLLAVRLNYRQENPQAGQAEEVALILTVREKNKLVHLALWGRKQGEEDYRLHRITAKVEPAGFLCADSSREATGLDGFPIEWQGSRILLRIPFLDGLRLEMSGNPAVRLKAKRKAVAAGQAIENLSGAQLEALLAPAGDQIEALPYDLTPHLMEIMGQGGYPLPAGARLLLTDLEVSWSGASAALLLLCQTEGLALPFIAEGASIGPNHLGLGSLNLHLPRDIESANPALPATFRQSGWVSLACQGPATFHLPVTYHFDPEQLARPAGAGRLSLEFVIQGRDPFNFIAPLDLHGGAAHFVVTGGEGQVFHLRKGFADFSLSENSPLMPGGLPNSYSGFHFSELDMELEGFGNSGLLIPCRDFLFCPGQGLGLQGEAYVDGLIGEEAPLDWGGWLFTIDRFRYRIANNTVGRREALGRLRLPHSPGWPWLPYRLQLNYKLEAREPGAAISLEDPAFRAYLAQEGITNYSLRMQLTENNNLRPVLLVDGSPARFDYCLRLGDSLSIALAEGPEAISPSYTKEAWIYLYPGAGGRSILAGQSTCLGLTYNDGYYLTAGHNGQWQAVMDTEPLQPNTWYHVAVTYEAATQEMCLYRNGRRVASGRAPLHNESRQFIGGPPGLPGFGGRIDEIRLWNRALTSGEISASINREAEAGAPGLAACYRLDEGPGSSSLQDQAGGRRAAIGGAADWSGRIARSPGGAMAQAAAARAQNQALRFDGEGGRLSLGRRLSLSGGPFTIEFRAKRKASGGREEYLAGQGFAANDKGLNIGFLADGSFAFDFYNNRLRAAIPTGDTSWHHWACVFDANAAPGRPNRFIYRDGRLLASDVSPALYQGQGEFFIGAGMNAARPFAGMADEFRIWRLARSPEEIQADMGQRLLGFNPGLLAYYPMGENPLAGLIQDHSGHGHAASLEGAGLSVGPGALPLAAPPAEATEAPLPASLVKRLEELVEKTRQAKAAALDTWSDEAQVAVEFRSEFRELVALAGRQADSVALLANQILGFREMPEGNGQSVQEALSQAERAAEMAEAAAADARSLVREVRFYPLQASDYAAIWNDEGKIAIRYRDFEAYQRVKNLMATDNPFDEHHWDIWHKSHYSVEYTRRGAAWAVKKDIKRFPFPGQAAMRGNRIRLNCYPERGKAVTFEASRPAVNSGQPIPLEIRTEKTEGKKAREKTPKKYLLLAENERYQERERARLRLEADDGSPPAGLKLIIINGRQEKIADGKIKGRRRPRFTYTHLLPNGAREKVNAEEPALELAAGKPYLALLKDKRGRMALAGLDSSFWNSAPMVEFSPFQRPKEANRLLKQELLARLKEHRRQERQKAPPPLPILEPVQANGKELSLSWQLAAEGGDSLRLELYRRRYAPGAAWALIHQAPASEGAAYTDMGAAEGQLHEYALQAVRPNGLASGLSQTVVGQLAFEEERYQLINLLVRKTGGAGIQLSWQGLSGESAYDVQVYRSFGSEAPRPFVRLSGTTEHFTDSAPAPGAVCNYAVQVILSDGRRGKMSAVMSVLY